MRVILTTGALQGELHHRLHQYLIQLIIQILINPIPLIIVNVLTISITVRYLERWPIVDVLNWIGCASNVLNNPSDV